MEAGSGWAAADTIILPLINKMQSRRIDADVLWMDVDVSGPINQSSVTNGSFMIVGRCSC